MGHIRYIVILLLGFTDYTLTYDWCTSPTLGRYCKQVTSHDGHKWISKLNACKWLVYMVDVILWSRPSEYPVECVDDVKRTLAFLWLHLQMCCHLLSRVWRGHVIRSPFLCFPNIDNAGFRIFVNYANALGGVHIKISPIRLEVIYVFESLPLSKLLSELVHYINIIRSPYCWHSCELILII